LIKKRFLTLTKSAIAVVESSGKSIALAGKTLVEFNSAFIHQKQGATDNKIDLSQQARSKILLINDKAV